MHKLFIGMAAVAFSATSFAQQSGLEACAEIEDSLERLVCYDNLAKKNSLGRSNVKTESFRSRPVKASRKRLK